MNKKKLILNSLFSFFIAFICLYIFYDNSKGNINFNILLDDLIQNWHFLILAIILLNLSVYVRALRWQNLINENIPIKDLFSAQLVGYFINNILPIRIGDIFKGYSIANKYKKNNGYILGTIITERIFDTFTLIFIFTLLIYSYSYQNIITFNFQLIFGLALTFILILLFFKKYLFKSLPTFSQLFFTEIIRGIKSIDPMKYKSVIILSFLIWGIYLINVYLIQMIFPTLNLNIFECALILFSSSIIQMIPSGFGAIGLFQIGAESVLLELGFTNYQNFLILLWAYSYFSYTIIGAYYFIQDNSFKIRKILDTIKKLY